MKLILFLMVVAGVVIYMKVSPQKSPRPVEKPPEAGLTYGELNRIKNDSAQERALKKERIRLENEVLTPQVSGETAIKETPPHVVDIQPLSGSLDTEIENPKDRPTLDGKMDAFLAEKEQFEELQTARKKEYAAEFMKKALQMGYDVKINDDMQITEIRKVQPGRRGSR